MVSADRSCYDTAHGVILYYQSLFSGRFVRRCRSKMGQYTAVFRRIIGTEQYSFALNGGTRKSMLRATLEGEVVLWRDAGVPMNGLGGAVVAADQVTAAWNVFSVARA
jgi:hypothetical protein